MALLKFEFGFKSIMVPRLSFFLPFAAKTIKFILSLMSIRT